MLTGDARSAIHWLEELGVEFTRDEDGGYRLARCGGASAKRLLQVGDRTGHAITKQLREAWEGGAGTSFTNAPLHELAQVNGHWSARVGERTVEAGTVVLAAGGRCYAVAEERGELSTNHPNATGEVTKLAHRARRGGARPRRAAVPPERRRVAAEHAGLLDPGDDARLRRRAAQLGGRGVHRLARPARRGQPGDRRRGQRGPRRRDARRPSRRVPRHDAHPGSRRGDLAAVHAAPLPRRGDRSAAREDPHLPGAPLPERRARDRHGRRDDAGRAFTPPARSRAARTGATA